MLIRRRNWPIWALLLLVIVLILEMMLVCGNASLFNLVTVLSSEATQLGTSPPAPIPANSVAFAPDSTRLAAGFSDGTVRVWQVAQGGLEQTLQVSERAIAEVVFSPDGVSLATAARDGQITLWQVESWQPTRTLTFKSPPLSLAFSPDGRRLATGLWDGTLAIRSVAESDEQPPSEWAAHSDWISDVAFSPDGEALLSGSNDGSLRLWQAETGTLRWEVDDLSEPVLGVAFSPDGSILASASFAQGVQLWLSETGEPQQRCAISLPVWDVVFAPDGLTLISATEAGRQPCRVADGTLLESPAEPPDAILSLDYAAQADLREDLLAAGFRDGRVMLFQLADGAGQWLELPR